MFKIFCIYKCYVDAAQRLIQQWQEGHRGCDLPNDRLAGIPGDQDIVKPW